MWKSDAFIANSSKTLNKDLFVNESAEKDSKKKADELWRIIRHRMPSYIWEWSIVFSDEIIESKYPLKHYVRGNRPDSRDNVIVPENARIEERGNEPFEVRYDPVSKRLISTLLGQYDEKNDIITLYVKAIKNICSGLDNFEEIIDFVLAHEIFHAVHYYLVKNTPKTKEDERCRMIVKESLASFYEYEYCKKKGYDWRSDELIRTWCNYSYGDWPYAGARVFLNQNYNNNSDLPDKFMDVLDHSCISWEFACGEIRGNDKYWDSYPSSKL